MNESFKSVNHYTANLGLQAIEEKNSEFDAREEIDRQNAAYQKSIQRLKDELDGIHKEVRHKKDQVQQIQNESMSNVVPFERLSEDKSSEILQLEDELKQLESSLGNGEIHSMDQSNINESVTPKNKPKTANEMQ